MKEEISVASSCITRLLQLTSSGSLSAEELASFESSLNQVLNEHYADHWHVEDPTRGHAYRCLRVNMFDRCDPSLREAARRASIRFDALAFPDELTIWIDPNEVTLRIGEDKSFSWSLYSCRNGKGESLIDSVDFVDVLQRAEELRECDPKWIVYRQSGVRANTRGAHSRGERKDSVNIRGGDSGISSGRDSAALSNAYLPNAAMYNQHAGGPQNQYGYPNTANYYYDSAYYYYSQFCGYDDYAGSQMNYSAGQQPYYVPQKHGSGRNTNANGSMNGNSSAGYAAEHGGMQHRSRAGGYSKLGGSALPNGALIGRGGAPINGYHRSSATPLGAGRESPVKSPARFNPALLSSASKNLASLGSQGALTASNDDLSHNQSIGSVSSAVETLF